MLCTIVFSQQETFKFAMLLTSLRLASEHHHLLLNDNPALRLDASALRVLSELRVVSLNLSCCDMEALPPQLNLFKSLRHLYLERNKLSRLPISLGKLKLQTLNLDHNSFFEVPPQDVVDKGRRQVLKYLQERAAQGQKSCRAQLVLLGVDGAQNSVLQALLSSKDDHSNAYAESWVHADMDLHEWRPKRQDCHDSDDDISVAVLRVGLDWHHAHLYRAFMSARASYVLAYKVPRTRGEASKTTAALLEQLHDLYLHLPGISVILVAVAEDTHDASAALRVESVESALQGLVHRQQRDIDQAGNLSTARPIRLWDNGKSHVLDVGSGGGARDVRRVVVAHIQQADSYGAIVPRSFLQVRRQIAQLRTCWMSWDSFRQLCLRSGACPSASQQEYQCVCRAFERNALAKLHRGLPARAMAMEERAGSSSLGGQTPEVAAAGTSQADEARSIFCVCRLQGALRRVREEFRYLKRLRRILANSLDAQVIEVFDFLSGSGEVFFFSLAFSRPPRSPSQSSPLFCARSLILSHARAHRCSAARSICSSN